MNTEMKNAVKATDKEAQYDQSAKRLLGHKSILAHILVKTVDEFQGMDPKEVVSYIEGTPFISTVPIEPGLTNAEKEEEGQRIVGFNSENQEINEGLVRFDIVFYVRMKDGLSQIIVNIECQRKEPSDYDILNRAIFYVSRLVSSQKERDFVGSKFNDIRRVFSIWLCMNMDENCMNYVHLANDGLLGSHQWKGKLDLLNIVLIGISNELPEHDEKYELHRLLGALLSMDLSVEEKLSIIETEYEIPVENSIREDVMTMCNLSQGILERGWAEGEARGREEGRAEAEEKIIIAMHKQGFTLEQITGVMDKDMEEVKAILEKSEPVLV